MHASARIPLRHLLVEDAAPRRHPLHIAGAEAALIAEAVGVRDVAGEDVGDRLDAAVRMPREAGAIVLGVLVAEIIEEEEGIGLFGVAEAEGAAEMDAGAFDGGSWTWVMRRTGRMDMGGELQGSGFRVQVQGQARLLLTLTRRSSARGSCTSPEP